MSIDDYLALEAQSDVRHEFSREHVIAMTGASRRHNLICGNAYAMLHQQIIDRPCEVYQSDMRVQINTGTETAYRYPDIVVVCEPPGLADTTPESLINPTVLIEVLSPSTAIIDRDPKLSEYQQIASVQAYVLISQTRPRIECYLRQPDTTWQYINIAGLQNKLPLPSIECVLHLRDVYHKVPFED
jgi:Uma2 family endonuclease